MGDELRFIWESKRWRVLCFMAMAFAVIILLQYFEFPYGSLISSLFSAEKAQIPVIASSPPEDSSQNPKVLVNTTHFEGGSNFTGTNDVYKGGNITKSEEDVVTGHDLDSERNGDSEDFIELDDDNSKSTSTLEKYLSSDTAPAISPISLPPLGSVAPLTFPTKLNTNASAPAILSSRNMSLPNREVSNSLKTFEDPGTLHNNLAPPANDSSMGVKEIDERPLGDVVSISEMNYILFRNRVSPHSMKPQWSATVDQELLNAKSQIEHATVNGKDSSLSDPLYRNASMFKRSYELMEKTLKVYIYKEGARPVFHQPVLKGIYASEGWFMKQLKANKHFITKRPRDAHLFYLPFGSRNLEETLYVPNSHSRKNLVQYLKNYLDAITSRYNFWNRTGGADHFLVACHDWAPAETEKYMNNCIRALCNADIKNEGFMLGKDVSLPETFVRSAQNPLRELGGKPPAERSILAFFAGSMHGDLRPILLHHWENKDPDMKIFGKLPKSKNNRNYLQYMKSSKYCICAKGYEVNSPRVVEAIFYECVPVIISDNFVPPFFEVLNWESFALFVQEKDIPNLKKILLSIPDSRYLELQQRVIQVQKHFLWHPKPVKYDIFHMILHSIWYNRVFQIRSR